jgi:pimeloyl-ACP methyl ester carboxylesterase
MIDYFNLKIDAVKIISTMKTNNYFYDDNAVRYQLVKTNPGNIIYNWLFVPGGPGVDSHYFLTLIKELDVPGNFWLIDLPANGSNITTQIKADYDFDTWGDCLLSTIQKFQNPIYIGHSFSGMLPLLLPQLEQLLKGFLIFNSAPSLWLEEAAKCAKEHHLPLLEAPVAEFGKNPNPATFKTLLLACAPYYFPADSLEMGQKLLEQMTINYLATVWWLKKVHEINYNATWIPQKVPTLILGASHDFITPYSLFENDTRFQRKNITLSKIQNAGHFPWLEQMAIVKEAFSALFKQVVEENKIVKRYSPY